jgi:3-oxoacyl-[acyl-carrier-protein] synthase II
MLHRVVVTGIGAIVAGATGKDQLLDLLLRGSSSIGTLTRFNSKSLPCSIAGEIMDFNPSDYMDRKVSRRMDRAAQLAVGAARLACVDASLDISKEDTSQTGVFEGTSLGPLNCTLENHRRYLTEGCKHAIPTMLTSSMMGAGSGFIALELGIHGPSLTISDGSASSAYAIGYGFRNIKAGYATVAIAGGAEAPLSEEIFATFCCARLLSAHNQSPREAMRPFDRDRDGFVLGEGATFLVLEELSHALGRGAHVYGEIVGFGETTDAFHPTSPHPAGEWVARAMDLALKEGGVRPEEVHYINAHGTATKANDIAETRAIKRVFGNHSSTLHVSSTKPIVGHLLGACGGLEAAMTMLSMEHEFIPPTLNLSNPDQECDLDYVRAVGRQQHIEIAMSNNYSFGGRNASLLFKHFPHSESTVRRVP